MRILVTGGVRSGKSTHAEALIGDEPATYVAPGPTPDEEADPDWAARIAAHQARRPASWTTRGDPGPAGGDQRGPDPVLVDCLGTWLTALMDAPGAWEQRGRRAHDLVVARTDEVAAARARVRPRRRPRDQRGRPRGGARAPLRSALPRPARHGQPTGRGRLRRGAPRGGRSGAAAVSVGRLRRSPRVRSRCLRCR